MGIDTRRQIDQLWLVAGMYFELAMHKKRNLSQSQLTMTIGEFAKECECQSFLHQNTAQLYAVAHLMSCAVRLYSIEELLRSARWDKYNDIKKQSDQTVVKQELNNHVDQLIHFFLRHMVAHSESERKRSRYRKAFDAMYEIYLDLNYQFVFEKMAATKGIIAKEIGYA